MKSRFSMHLLHRFSLLKLSLLLLAISNYSAILPVDLPARAADLAVEDWAAAMPTADELDKLATDLDIPADLFTNDFLDAGNFDTLSVHPALPSVSGTVLAEVIVPPIEGVSAAALSRAVINETAKSRPHACSNCGVAFARHSDLACHLRTHTGEKSHACSDCGAAFARSDALTRHLRTHTGEKFHACSDCGAAFAQRSHLTEHLRTHTGEKPCACSHCGAAFAQRSTLTVHLRTHTGEKPHVCSDCGAAFAQRSHLTVHLRTHTGEKPYACADCGLAWANKSNLTRHIEKTGHSASRMPLDTR